MSYIYILLTVFLFSTLEIAGKLIGSNISPIGVTIYRFLIGGLVMLPICLNQLKKTKQKISIKDFGVLSIPGIVNVVIAMLSLQFAIFYGEASLSAILISANPIFVAIFARIILKEKISFLRALGLFIGLVGVSTIIGLESFDNSNAQNPFLGVLFGCIASVSFGLYTVLSKKYVKYYGNVVSNTFAFLMGSIILGLIAILAGFDLTFEITKFNIMMILYLGIFVSGLAYLSYFEGLKKVPTAVGAMLFFLKPVIASILAYIIFGEDVTKGQILGIAIVILGINFDKIVSKIMSKR